MPVEPRIDRSIQIWLLAIAIMWLLPLAGCGDISSLKRAVVVGEVKYQGKPINDGSIRFVPIKDTGGPAAAAMIADGRYSVMAGGGVPLGTHRVEIIGLRDKPKIPSPPNPAVEEFGGGKQEYIPEKYNRKSTLEVTIEAAGDGEVVQDFDLK